MGFKPIKRTLDILSGLARNSHCALMLRKLNAQIIIAPLALVPGDVGDYSLFPIIFMIGQCEALDQDGDSPIMMIRPDIFNVITQFFDTLLDTSFNGRRPCPVGEMLQACLALSVSDSNKQHLRSSRMLAQGYQILNLFASNAPEITSVKADGTVMLYGGGGNDKESARLSIELLLQLSFSFPDQLAMREAFNLQCCGIIGTLKSLLAVKGDRELDRKSLVSAGHLLSLISDSSPSKKVAGTRPGRHAMLSYCWAANKHLVVALGEKLRAMGLEVLCAVLLSYTHTL